MRGIITFLFMLMTVPVFPISPDEALEFLYSIMPLPDKTDYPREFHERNVKVSFKALNEMPWGKIVPEREFKHFVLPVRVNNEHLDDARTLFFEELKDRVKTLSMEDAILEVNHWCHEKVTYRPSDSRTSSPLSSMSQAIGRCGEESTFTVAALRSVGIPARQIYTPRWAHTDDNHAWVEAWANGRWYFIGACEPEAVLNLAWFNEPASRGIIMSTNVVGDYDGPEEVLMKEPLTTKINVTGNYAKTGLIKVKVVSSAGKPVSGATVNFCIYNYSEFYPAVSKTADTDGFASLNAGIGDVLVWATDGDNYGFSKASSGVSTGMVEVILDKSQGFQGTVDMDLTPAVSSTIQTAVTNAQKDENKRRMQIEDSIRGAYCATFLTKETADSLLAGVEGLEDAEVMSSILQDSRGNHAVITGSLLSLPESSRSLLVRLLETVSEKDLRDIEAEVIADVLNYAWPRRLADVTDDVYNRYILNPRVENEHLYPWRGELRKRLPRQLRNSDPEGLVSWTLENIEVADDENPQKIRMSPGAVFRNRKSDRLSRSIFFVAAARTIGLPARIDPVTGATQYLQNGRWVIADLSGNLPEEETSNPGKGWLKVNFKPQGYLKDPQYYSQFSISKIDNGIPRQLEFAEDGTVNSIFDKPVELDAGDYMMVSGQRLANGGVLAKCDFFSIGLGENVVRQLVVRNDDTALSVIGSLNAENLYRDLVNNEDKSIISTTGRGYYIAALVSPGHEPSTHFLNDMSSVAAQLDSTGMKILILFDNDDEAERFSKEAFPKLPQNVVFGVDKGNALRKEITSSLNIEETVNPIVVVADTFNRIVWESTGYSIGTGERLLNAISRLR